MWSSWLIHLLGPVAYCPLETRSLPFKTTLLEGRLDVGAPGMQVFAALCLLAALVFVVGVVGFVRPESTRPTESGADQIVIAHRGKATSWSCTCAA